MRILRILTQPCLLRITHQPNALIPFRFPGTLILPFGVVAHFKFRLCFFHRLKSLASDRRVAPGTRSVVAHWFYHYSDTTEA